MITLAALLLVLTQDDSPQWGGFRGNNGSGVAASKSIPATLDPEETAMWRIDVPPGYSSPVIAGSRLFVTGVDGEKLVTQCIDRGSGDELWRREIEFDGQRVGMNSSAAPSPTTDGEHVFVLFHAIGLVAYGVDGEELWRQEIGPFNIPHGMATSPVLHDDLLIQVVDQDLESYVVAYDKRSGEQRWRTERPGVTHSYATPAIYQPAKGDAQVVVSGALHVKGYAVVDGQELWSFGGSAWQTKCVPVVVGDDCFVNAYMVPSSEFGMPPMKSTFGDELTERDENEDGLIERSEWPGEMIQQAWFIFDLDGDDKLDEEDWTYMKSSGRSTGGLYSIDMTGKGDVTKTNVNWKFGDRRGLPDCPTPLYFDDTLYMIKEGGLLTSIDPATGEVKKQDRVGEPDPYFASPVGAAGRIVTASASGQLAVIQTGPEWEVLSVTRLEDAEIWSTPAIADGQVFVRTQAALWCFEELED